MANTYPIYKGPQNDSEDTEKEQSTTYPVYKGLYPVNKDNNLDGLLKQSIESFEAAATRFSIDAISDAKERANYNKNIKRISEIVKSEVASGKSSVKDGAEFCHLMRNAIMEEVRIVSSPQGRSLANKMKPEGRTLDSLLSKYSETLFKKPFSQLSEIEKNKVHYSVIESSARGQTKMNVGTKRMRIIGKVGLLATAGLAIYSISVADNKPKEAITQGSIIAGGVAGGWVAGLAVSTLCGPAAPMCAVAVILAGSFAGGYAAGEAIDSLDEELEEFTQWKMK